MAAGNLFDYVEAVERVIVENKFFVIFKSIMLVLFILVVVLFKAHFNTVTGVLPRIKELLILGVIGGSGYELLIFTNFRDYLRKKIAFHAKRRAKFIENLWQDFRRDMTSCSNGLVCDGRK
jgi:hypothetical protein